MPLTTTVVKDYESTIGEIAETLPTMNFEQRVEWVLENRHHLRKSRRHWARLAGLSDRTLNQAVLRSRSADDNSPNLSIDSAHKLAEAAQVDRRWLESGIGTPDLSYAGIESYDTHAMRREAALLLEEADKMDPKEAWWLMRDLEAPQDKVTWRTFYTAARALAATAETVAASTMTKPQLSAGKVAAAGALLRRKNTRTT